MGRSIPPGSRGRVVGPGSHSGPIIRVLTFRGLDQYRPPVIFRVGLDVIHDPSGVIPESEEYFRESIREVTVRGRISRVGRVGRSGLDHSDIYNPARLRVADLHPVHIQFQSPGNYRVGEPDPRVRFHNPQITFRAIPATRRSSGIRSAVSGPPYSAGKSSGTKPGPNSRRIPAGLRPTIPFRRLFRRVGRNSDIGSNRPRRRNTGSSPHTQSGSATSSGPEYGATSGPKSGSSVGSDYHTDNTAYSIPPGRVRVRGPVGSDHYIFSGIIPGRKPGRFPVRGFGRILSEYIFSDIPIGRPRSDPRIFPITRPGPIRPDIIPDPEPDYSGFRIEYRFSVSKSVGYIPVPAVSGFGRGIKSGRGVRIGPVIIYRPGRYRDPGFSVGYIPTVPDPGPNIIFRSRNPGRPGIFRTGFSGPAPVPTGSDNRIIPDPGGPNIYIYSTGGAQLGRITTDYSAGLGRYSGNYAGIFDRPIRGLPGSHIRCLDFGLLYGSVSKPSATTM